MKTLRNLTIAATACLIGTLPAAAATSARGDHSGLLVWIFLGLCALIIVAQAMPAAVLLVGMIRAAVHAKRPVEEAVKR